MASSFNAGRIVQSFVTAFADANSLASRCMTIVDVPGASSYKVDVKMTLTAPGCGMGPVIAEDARQKIARLPDVESAKVHIVWDPQWTPQMISDTGRKVLGLE